MRGTSIVLGLLIIIGSLISLIVYKVPFVPGFLLPVLIGCILIYWGRKPEIPEIIEFMKPKNGEMRLTFYDIEITDNNNRKSLIQYKQNIFIYERVIVLSGYINNKYKIINKELQTYQLVITCHDASIRKIFIIELTEEKVYMYNKMNPHNLFTFAN